MCDDERSCRPVAPSAKRACDACKRRKVRCDTASIPCSNCAIARIQCSYRNAPQRRGPKRKTLRHQTTPSSLHHADPSQDNVLAISGHDSDESFESVMVQSAPTVSLETYHGSSPRQIPALSSYVSPTKAIQDELRRCLATVIQQPLEVITNRCITLYIEHLFPVAPIIHEHSMRSFAPLLELRFEFESSSLQLSSARYREKLSHIRNWTLLTALCAATAFLLPSSLFPERDLLGQHFLRASRDMLRNYQDIDIEQPDYSSLAVRYYHSNALHAVGKTMVSWHVLGEAVRLSQEMRLYDEQSYRDIDPLEAHLRRSIFWQIYTADKSAAILNDCPVALHEICLGIPLTVSYPGPPDQYLRPTLLSASAGYTESHVVTGFNLCQDLWARASGLLVKLDALMILQHSIESPTVSEHFREIVARDHLQFISTLDNLRSDVTPVTPATVESECAATQIDRAKDVQRTNLLVTFHCLRLVILQKFVKNGLSSLLGISEDPLALALRKTEIASDMIRTLSESPFESLQINGEPCVEKIRRVGVTLLEIVHEVNSRALVERGKSLFITLLDVLARLDSRVSAELSINRGF